MVIEVNRGLTLTILSLSDIQTQIAKWHEELEELSGALDENDPEHIAEELADVMVIADQIASHYKINNSDISRRCSQKQSRTVRRLTSSKEATNGQNRKAGSV